MANNRILIAVPTATDQKDIEKKQAAVDKQLRQFGYNPIRIGSDPILEAMISEVKNLPPDTDVNQSMLFIGFLFTVSATCGGIYFTKGWDEDAVLSTLHGVASYYGLKVMYEEVPSD